MSVHPLEPLNVSREEVAFRSVGCASQRVREAGDELLNAFAELQAARDALTEQHLGEVHVAMAKPIESAWATWRNEASAVERGVLKQSQTWPVPERTESRT